MAFITAFSETRALPPGQHTGANRRGRFDCKSGEWSANTACSWHVVLVASTKSPAFDAPGLACSPLITSEILGYTLVIRNIRLENSNIRCVVYSMKSEKLTINHVSNLKNDWPFPQSD
jgi:hypothetical protein